MLDNTFSIRQPSAKPLLLYNVHLLTPVGWRRDSSIRIVDGIIEALGPGLDDSLAQRIDGHGAYLMPGIIDLHGDAFERHITPRAGASFPLDLALAANDASLVANGITTFYYSITDGFEPGPRSRETVRQLLQALERLAPRLSCQPWVHIRHEQANSDDHEELLDWIRQGRLQMLSLNDHLPPLDNPRKVERYLSGLHRRVAMSDQETTDFLAVRQASRATGEGQTWELAAAAHRHGVVLSSHDDESQADVTKAIELKTAIAEFPMSLNIARAFQDAGIAVLMGAPNLVRGGSHVGATGVREAIEQHTVDILCSDYHYPSLYRAAFLVAELGLLPLKDAWKLVSQNPAAAAGLGDRKGRIAPGYDADLLLVRELDGLPVSLESTLVRGVPVFTRRSPGLLLKDATDDLASA